MDAADLAEILKQVESGELSPDAAQEILREKLRHLPYKDVGFAKLDYHRELRQGFGEVIYAPGKTPEQCAVLVKDMLENSSAPVLLSRPDKAQTDLAVKTNPGATVGERLVYWRQSVNNSAGKSAGNSENNSASKPANNSASKSANDSANDSAQIVIITAGTADAPVAAECAETLAAHGLAPVCISDVGVAGLHRLLNQIETLLCAEFVIVVAGMEGALASVVGGITPAPVIAVPTSAGYGSSFEGVTALLSMLASCATGISVVGIDNGLGAGFAALRQLRLRGQQPVQDHSMSDVSEPNPRSEKPDEAETAGNSLPLTSGEMTGK